MGKNLFIFSFDRALSWAYRGAESLGIGSFYFWRYVLWASIFLLSVLVLLRLRGLLSGRAKGLLWAVLTVLVLRTILFDTPLTWRLCLEYLPTDALSFLKAKIYVSLIRDRQLIPRKRPCLIIGSSAMTHAFRAFEKSNPEIRFIYSFGMKAAEAAFSERRVKVLNPSLVVVYLTEREMSSFPADEEKYQSFYGFEDLHFPLLFKRYRGEEETRCLIGYLLRSLAGWVFPEYRHAFIFRGIFHASLGRPVLKRFADLPPDQALEAIKIGQANYMVREMRSPIIERNMDINLEFLEDFLRFCRREGIRVVLLQGRLNPVLDSKAMRAVRKRMVGLLAGLAGKYDHVRFVGEKDWTAFTRADFKDMIHLREQASLR
ncbi:MAG: hypothetical protein HY714_06110, partial [Candidatus Omnitrophica bacterium]|nr:hypothetical protein [Candidatus Omnitrophota bacterium]